MARYRISHQVVDRLYITATTRDVVRAVHKAMVAEVFKVQSDRTIRKWEAGERAIPGPAVVLMTYWLQSGVKFAKVADTWLLQGGDVRDDWF
mgnify:CR=1 FL=1